MKLLDHLSLQYPNTARNRLKKWILAGRVTIDGSVHYKPHTPIDTTNQVVNLSSRRLHLKEDLKILYHDQDIIVVAKPAGLLSVAHDSKQLPNCHSILKKQFPSMRIFPVHRLDRDTSGILLFACNEPAKNHLKDQFFHHTIVRKYRAFVEGHLDDQGTWESYLSEDASLFVRVCSDTHEGKLAITHFETIKHYPLHSEVIFTLQTGRKNQIRAQALHANTPIAGDKKYGAKTNPFKRLALHAEMLEITHPTTEKRKNFMLKAPFNWKLAHRKAFS